MTITDDDIAALSAGERHDLIDKLGRLGSSPVQAVPGWRSPRLIVLLGATAAGLLAWIVLLGFMLPGHATAGTWRPVWIGFDTFELLGLVLTLGAAWRARQVLVPAALITGTLFIADAWFDVMLSWGTSDTWLSIAAAAFVELPLATVLMLTARGVINRSIALMRVHFGVVDESVRLCDLPVPLPEAAATPQVAMTMHHRERPAVDGIAA